MNTPQIMIDAMEKIMTRVKANNHLPTAVSTVTLTQRRNSTTGLHVHAHCVVKLHYDEMVTEREVKEGY